MSNAMATSRMGTLALTKRMSGMPVPLTATPLVPLISRWTPEDAWASGTRIEPRLTGRARPTKVQSSEPDSWPGRSRSQSYGWRARAGREGNAELRMRCESHRLVHFERVRGPALQSPPTASIGRLMFGRGLETVVLSPSQLRLGDEFHYAGCSSLCSCVA